MAAVAEANQQQDCSAMKDELAKYTDKMMSLKLSQLQKHAKKKGVPNDAIEAAVADVDDEEDAKEVLIRLILKAVTVQATPSPTRARSGAKLMFHAHTCQVCIGCVRPPGHDGPCMDGECNEIKPQTQKEESSLDVGLEVARHKVVKEEVARKVEEETAAQDAARRKAAEEKEAAKKAAKEAAARKAAEEEAAKQEEEANRRKAKAALQAIAEEEAVLREAVIREAVEEAAHQKAKKEAAQRKAAEEQAAREQAAQEEAARQLAAQRQAAEEEAARRKAAEEDAARQKAAAEEAARQRAEQEEAAFQKRVEEEIARRKVAEEELKRVEAEAEAKRKEVEERRARQQEEEKAEMAAMDARCVQAFLDCTTSSNWRERPRTPVKGTILYTKHMRPCRPAGTSVDVKDSSFIGLANFLQFLEGEGLLRLRPGCTDPWVEEIHSDACRRYKYVPEGWPAKEAVAPSPVKLAPNAGASLLSSPIKLAPNAGETSGSSWLGCSKRFQ